MKLKNVYGVKHELPNEAEVCEIIMRLPSPVHVMAWLMAETGCRLTAMQEMRISDYDERTGRLCIGTESGGLRVDVSPGLKNAIDDYLVQLREKFERRKWGRGVDYRRVHLVHHFRDQLLFPAWSMYGYERCEINSPIAQMIALCTKTVFCQLILS